MDATATVITQIFDVLVLPFGRTHHTLQLIWVSLLAGFGMAYVFKLTSSQKTIKRAKDRLKARILEMRLYQDDPVLIFKGLGGALKQNFVYLGSVFVPFVIIVVPMAIVFMQLDQRYAHSYLTRGSTTRVSVQLKDGFNPYSDPVELNVDGGLTLRGKPVRDAVSRETDWRIRVDTSGTHDVSVYAKGATYSFPLVAGPSYRMIGRERNASALLEPLVHPGLPKIPVDSPFERIVVEYPPAKHWLLGWQVHWIVIFLVYSLLAALALKILIGIEI